jgi:hypothetical protein
MYFRVNDRIGQSPEEQREFEEQKRQFERRKAEHEKRLAPLPVGILPLNVFKKEGVKTITRVSQKTASLIQDVLERSRVLRPFIEQKLRRIMIPTRFVHHQSDEEFDYAYTKLHNLVIPIGSAEEKELKARRGFYHPRTDTIHLRPFANVGHALHEAIHKYASSGFRAVFGGFLDEGVTQYFTNCILREQGVSEGKAYEDNLRCANVLVRLFSHDRVAMAYFQGDFQRVAGEVARRLNINLLQLHTLRKGSILCERLRKLRP